MEDFNEFLYDIKRERDERAAGGDEGRKLVTAMDMEQVKKEIRQTVIDTNTEPEEGDRPYRRLLETRIMGFTKAFALFKFKDILR